MGFLFFIILIIIIASVGNNEQNNKNRTSCQQNFYLTSTHNYSNYPREQVPKIEFHSNTDTVNLFGYSIRDSYFYTCYANSDMPFAINVKSKPDFATTPTVSLGYWPHYSRINHSQQGYFIKWLANDKPIIEDLGYAYIYYYGLEYRVLNEQKDLKPILFEIIKLVTKFPRLNYGYDLISYLIFNISEFFKEEVVSLIEFIEKNNEYYKYNKLRNSLLYKLDEEYFIKNIRFSWADFEEDNINGLSGRKGELYKFYFANILKQYAPKEIYTTRQTSHKYHMAMFGGMHSITYSQIVPSDEIRQIRRQAISEIKHISQNIKKFDSSSEPLTEIEKLAYLPPKLRANIDFNNDIDFGEKTVSSIEVIANKLGFKIQEKATLRQSLLLVDACNALGYDIEPNANLEKKPYKKNSLVIIYKNADTVKSYSKDYNITSLFMDIGFKIALEDKELLPCEIAYIDTYLNKEFNILSSEKNRLKIKKELIMQTQEINTTDTIKKLIKSVDNSEKEMIAKYLISVAMADGIVKDSELKLLNKIFKQLEFPDNYLDVMLSELTNCSDEVVVVQTGTSVTKKGSKIPTEQENDSKLELKLDTEKLEKIKLNTSEIHNVLQEIFANEQAEILKLEPTTEENLSTDKDQIEIESNLQSIINIILKKENWTRNELLNIVQDKGVMLSSAIDQINEWAEEEFGDFLVDEDNDIYTLNRDVANLLKNKE